MHAVTIGAPAATSLPEFRILTDDELETVIGGTLEIGLGPLTLQINADSGCFAVWWGKDFVGGGCKK